MFGSGEILLLAEKISISVQIAQRAPKSGKTNPHDSRFTTHDSRFTSYEMLSNSIIQRLQFQHEAVTDLIRNIPEERLRLRPASGKWSTIENIAHLTAYQYIFLDRLKKIEKEESPLFSRYVGDDDPVFLSSVKRDLKDILEDLFTQRFILINRLKSLSEHALRQTGRHPVFGTLTIPQWTEFFLLHEAHHLFTIFKLVNDPDTTLSNPM